MAREFGISEVLNLVSQAPTEDEKVNILRKNDSHPLRMLLQFALDPRVTWLLPEGVPPYKPTPTLDAEGRLKVEMKKMHLFIAQLGVPLKPNLAQRKREELFIQVIESIHPADAKLLIAAKDKKIPYDGITVELINRAFPDLIYVETTEG